MYFWSCQKKSNSDILCIFPSMYFLIAGYEPTYSSEVWIFHTVWKINKKCENFHTCAKNSNFRWIGSMYFCLCISRVANSMYFCLRIYCDPME